MRLRHRAPSADPPGRDFEQEGCAFWGAALDTSGASVGAGVIRSAGFAEVRYELVHIPDRQTLICAGLLIRVP